MFSKVFIVALFVAYVSATVSVAQTAITLSNCGDYSIPAGVSGTTVKLSTDANIVGAGNLFTGLCRLEYVTMTIWSAGGNTNLPVTLVILEAGITLTSSVTLIRAMNSTSGVALNTSASVTWNFTPDLTLDPTQYYIIGIQYNVNGRYEAMYNTADTHQKIEYDSTSGNTQLLPTTGGFIMAFSQYNPTGTTTSNSTTGTTGTATTGTATTGTATTGTATTGSTTNATTTATTGTATTAGTATSTATATGTATSTGTHTTSTGTATTGTATHATTGSSTTTTSSGSITVFSALSALFIAVLVM